MALIGTAVVEDMPDVTINLDYIAPKTMDTIEDQIVVRPEDEQIWSD